MVMKNLTMHCSKFLKIPVILLLGILFTGNISALNYASNGTFDSGSSGWSFVSVSGGSSAYDPLTGRTANGSVIIMASSPSTTYSYWKQNITLTAGHQYVLYAFVKGTDVTGGAGAGIECMHSAGTVSSMHFNGTFDWTFTDVTFSPQTSDAEIRLCLGADSSASSGTVYFDDVFLIDKNDNRLLILASAALYNNYPAVRQAINTYRGDIQTRQDYYSQIITLGPGGMYDYTTAEQVKMITSFYYTNGGMDGLLIVGSEPDIPVAMARYKQGQWFGPSDLFYADVSHTWPTPEVVNGMNVYYLYEDYGDDINEWIFRDGKTMADYHPEMFYGRISAKTVKPGSVDGKSEAELISDEAELVVNYFTKIHSYRKDGENLDPVSLNRAASFFDDEFNWMVKSDVLGDQYNDMDLTQGLIPNMDIFVDEEITSIDKYKSVLSAGHRFLFFGNHGSPNSGKFECWENGVHTTNYITLQDMETEGTPVKANFINLFSCSTANFAQSEPGSSVPLGQAQKYYAGYLLFNNNYMLNVMANTFDGCEIDRPVFYDDLKNEQPIGIAFKDLMVDRQDNIHYPLTERMLFGDPLIVYHNISPADKGPQILSDLRRLDAHVGAQFLFTFEVGDPDDPASAVTMTLEKDPAIVSNCNFDSATRTLTWTPGPYDAGKDYKFTAIATDSTSGNTYTEEFTIPVRSFSNWIMTYDGAGGITGWQKSGTGTITDEQLKTLTPMGSVPLIKVDDNTAQPLELSQQVFNIVPNQDYKVLFYTFAFLFNSSGGLGGLISDEITLTINEISTTFQIEFKNLQEFTFNSGNNTSLTFTFKFTEDEPDLYLGTYISSINLINLSSGPPPAQIAIFYKNGEQNSSTNTLTPYFQVKNTGTSTINLSDVTIRYWYTKDSTTHQNFVCDYAQVGSGNVSGSFTDITPVTGADNYLLIGFTSSAGSLSPDQLSGEIQIRVYKDGWGNYTQSGDYSWVQSQTTYAENIKTTGYLNGALNYGTEP